MLERLNQEPVYVKVKGKKGGLPTHPLAKHKSFDKEK